MSTVPYLGSKITLISKSEIRYEGILYSIDTKESTIALAKVRSCGTEARSHDRYIPPRDEIYEYIIFRVSDIKDLQVCEAPKSSHSSLPHDPAIVQHSGIVPQQSTSASCGQHYSAGCSLSTVPHAPTQTSSYQHLQNILTSNQSHSGSSRSSTPSQRKSPTIDAGVQVSVREQRTVSSRMDRENIRPSSRDRSNMQNRRPFPQRSRQNSTGSRRISEYTRRGRGGYSGPRTIEKYDREFDFEQANAEFIELENKLSKSTLDDGKETKSEVTDENAYNKSKSFFDDISCEATQRSRGLAQYDWRQERKQNVETFGVAVSNSWYRRRRGRGGFRRGNFRGRGSYVTRPAEPQPQKTVKFNDVPTIKEVEVVKEPLPVIQIVEDGKTDLQEPTVKAEELWD